MMATSVASASACANIDAASHVLILSNSFANANVDAMILCDSKNNRHHSNRAAIERKEERKNHKSS